MLPFSTQKLATRRCHPLLAWKATEHVTLLILVPFERPRIALPIRTSFQKLPGKSTFSAKQIGPAEVNSTCSATDPPSFVFYSQVGEVFFRS